MKIWLWQVRLTVFRIKREDFFVKNAKDETFTEVLVRYGNKYQMDKAAASNSLFGGENQIEVATPEIVPAPTWGRFGTSQQGA